MLVVSYINSGCECDIDILRPVMSIMWHNDVNDVNVSHILGIRHIRLLRTDAGRKAPESVSFTI